MSEFTAGTFVGVPEGWRLVPVEPTPDMAAQTAYNGTHYSDPFDFEDFKKDYAAMLAAAPAQPAVQDQGEVQRLREALETVEHEHELLRQMKNCEIRRPRGSFGIAVMSDPLAIEWQALDSELQQLIDARRAALAAST